VKTLGMLGGMSWESTVPYYQIVNRRIAARLGGLHSAPLVLWCPDFAEIERLQHLDAWDQAGALLVAGGRGLVAAGAEVLILCTNTMHRVADVIERELPIPLLHIAEPTGAAIRAAGLRRVGLLGTRFTMEQAFYRERLVDRFDLEVLVPDAEAREAVHRIIFDELCRGIVRDASRDRLTRIVEALVARGAEGVILGCTELGMLLGPEDVDAPLFDTTRLHAEAAADALLVEHAAS
jgi:aspartate racemase